MGTEFLVSLESSNGVKKWCAEGDHFDGFKVLSIAGKDGLKLQNFVTEEIVLVQLRPAPIQNTNRIAIATLLPAESLNWNWIESSENPMRETPETLPEWAYVNWEGLDGDLKTDLLNYYRSHGWELEAQTRAPGRIYVRNKKIQNPFRPIPAPAERNENAEAMKKPITPR